MAPNPPAPITAPVRVQLLDATKRWRALLWLCACGRCDPLPIMNEAVARQQQEWRAWFDARKAASGAGRRAGPLAGEAAQRGPFHPPSPTPGPSSVEAPAAPGPSLTPLHLMFTEAAKCYRAQMPALLQLLNVCIATEQEEERLETFLANEPRLFAEQWKQWEQKMRRFYLEECPLDPDWVMKIEAAPVEKLDPASNERASSQPRQVFFNTKTGRVQENNPNELKIFATKNRQMAKAQQAREVAIQQAESRLQQLQRDKRNQLSSVEATLSQPLFL